MIGISIRDAEAESDVDEHGIDYRQLHTERWEEEDEGLKRWFEALGSEALRTTGSTIISYGSHWIDLRSGM